MQTALLAVAGLLVGVAIASRREGASRAWATWSLVLAGLAVVAAVALWLRR